MATRSRTSFQKRQKEILRLERQREKAAKRLQRKNAPRESDEGIATIDLPDFAHPETDAESEDSAEGSEGTSDEQQ